MDLKLSGRRVVITGGSRGIGLDTARRFAGEGAHVSICARNAETLEAAKTEISAGHDVTVHAGFCDLAEPEAISTYIAQAAEAIGGIDILVNNVTGGGTGSRESDWIKSVNIDILGTVRMTAAALPHLDASRHGCIINVASRSAFAPAPKAQAYGAAKAALMHLTTSQAAELAGKGIRVNCIAPGSTEFPGGFWEKMSVRNPELYASTLATFPFGRFGRQEDISSVMLFLASPVAGWITGQTLLVDGGQTLGIGT